MNRQQLIQLIKHRKSCLCIGLDPDTSKIPNGIAVDVFLKAIIDATRENCVAYKPNAAFFEALGPHGIALMQEICAYIGDQHFIIADAKRGDIGNTSLHYAHAFLKNMPCDAITVAPYMGRDSVEPFLQIENKWAIVLALTSNPGAVDFEMLLVDDEPLYMHVLRKTSSWGNDHNLMFVVGATRTEQLHEIRKIVPHHFLLIPGVGAQGGSLEDVCRFGMNDDIGILVNASRSILYASADAQFFAEEAAHEATQLHKQMAVFF
jgi:orotidine-5'-phosphate decarboxylase